MVTPEEERRIERAMDERARELSNPVRVNVIQSATGVDNPEVHQRIRENLARAAQPPEGSPAR